MSSGGVIKSILEDIHSYHGWLLEKETDETFTRSDVILYCKDAFAALFSRALKEPNTSLYSLGI